MQPSVPSESGRPKTTHRNQWNLVRFVGVCCLISMFCLLLSGCSATQQIRFRKEAFTSLKLLNTAAKPAEKEISQRTRLTLRSFDLEKLLKSNPNKVLIEIQKQVDREPTPDLVFSVSELAFLEARRHELLEPKLAVQYYLISAMHAFGYLFDPRFQSRRNSYDPHFREACLFYNDSLEKTLRLFGKISGEGNHSIDLFPERVFSVQRGELSDFNISCRHLSDQWNHDSLEPLRFASDYEVKGLQNEFRQYGLGVPLLAKYKPGTQKTKTTKYTTPSLCFPITAVLRFLPPGTLDANGRPLHARIELYDPLTEVSTKIIHQTVPLESDLTTPIAYSISDPRIASINTFGLVRSDLLTKPIPEVLGPKASAEWSDEAEEEWQRQSIQGLYMMQPHKEGKIPVIFVHGLWSSPMAWMEMFNALRGEPELRAKYEFYFYFYPSGQPFWISAAQLRKDLNEFRTTFDPDRKDPHFDDMILVGHSMGGLISHLQTMDSGEEFWDLVSEHSPDAVFQGKSEKTRQEMLDWFFFRSNPSIARVVSIATPHRGSRASNDVTQWFGKKIIKLPENVLESIGLTKENKDLLNSDSLLNVKTSIESLSPEQPVFEAMQKQRQYSKTRYHNIVGEIEQTNALSKMLPPSDGVVAVESAKLERYDSQITVQCEHTVIHSHPKTILEVRRILFEHLRSWNRSAAAAQNATVY